MKEISIIGATSPLGVRLTDTLAKQGYNVCATYRSPDKIPDAWHKHSSINRVRLNLPERSDLREIYKGRVVWLAHLDQGRFNEKESTTNLEPFLRFLHEARNADVEQITFVSSGGSVYGEAIELPIIEDHPRQPLSSYGKAKKALEDALVDFGRFSKTRVAIIRPGNIYGFERPESQVKGIVGAFLNSVSNQTPFTLIDEGRTIRDFVHVDDVCRAIDCAVTASQREIIWNVGTGIGSRMSDVLQLIGDRSGFEMPVLVHQDNYASDVNSNVLSIGRISSESEWRPRIALDEGIPAVIGNWKRSTLDATSAR